MLLLIGPTAPGRARLLAAGGGNRFGCGQVDLASAELNRRQLQMSEIGAAEALLPTAFSPYICSRVASRL